jgi:hypothetical protein
MRTVHPARKSGLCRKIHGFLLADAPRLTVSFSRLDQSENRKVQRKFMQDAKRLIRCLPGCFVAVLAIGLFTGCHSASYSNPKATTVITPLPEAPLPKDTPAPSVSLPPPVASVPATPPPPAVAPAKTAPAPVLPPVRIKAGLFTAFTDSDGNVWLPDQGFTDGETTDRPDDLQIANTKDPAFYRTERYSMTSFSYPVPNGKYLVKLHFAETFDGISGPGGRVFSFNVEGQEFKDFDIWVKAGGAQRAYIETVNVEVTDGKLDISFTPKEENPEINGIEILPAP